MAKAARTLAENHQSRTDTVEPEPDLPIEQLAALHYRPEAIALHSGFKRVSSLEYVRMTFKTVSEESLVLPEADRAGAVDAMAREVENACAGFSDEVPEAGPVFVAIRMKGKPRSMLDWLQNAPTLEVGFARSIDLLASRFEFEEYKRSADLPVTGLAFLEETPVKATGRMDQFAADAAVDGPLSVVVHGAVAKLAGKGVFRRLWPVRWVVVAAHDPVLAVLHLGR